VRQISYQHNPRIWFGIQTLANFPRVRPGELVSILEGNINRKTGEVVMSAPDTKEGKEKRVFLLEEDLDFIRRQPEAIDKTMPFFRHYSGRKFGPAYLWKWWNRACGNLGIEGVTLYPGTKHSSVTAARFALSPEEIKRYVTGHTSAAFDRYLLVDADTQREASAIIRAKSSDQVLTKRKGQQKSGKVLNLKGAGK